MSTVWSPSARNCLRMALALFATVTGTVGARADYAADIADHVESVGIYKGYTYSPGTDTSSVRAGADIEVETDATVSSIIVQPPPPAASLALEQDRRGRRPVRQGGVDWWWERSGDAALDALPDGDCTVTFTFTDGSSTTVSVPFIRENGTPLQFPAQVPALNGATAEKLVAGGPDITFSWAACTDPNATGVYFGIDADFGILRTDQEVLRSLQEDTAAQHRYDPSPDLPTGVFDAELAFADLRTGATAEGVAFEVAKYREQIHWLVVSQPDADLQQNLSGVDLYLGAGAAERSDALDFHAEIRTSAQVDTVAMRIPNSRLDEDELWGWEWTTEVDGAKTWTFNHTFASLQDFLDQYGFGPYGIYVQWNDGGNPVSRLTHVYFSAADASAAPLELPQQVPAFVAPGQGALLPSPVTFQWDAWAPADPAYASPLAGIRFAVGPAPETEGALEAFLDRTTVEYGPQALADGNYRAALYFAQARQGVTGDGIPFFDALFRTAERDFSVGQPGLLQVHIEPGAARSLGAKWSVDGGGTWHSPNEVVSLAPGEYTVTGRNVANWNLHSPVPEAVTVTSGATLEKTVTYETRVQSLDVILFNTDAGNSVDVSCCTDRDITAVGIQTAAGLAFELAAASSRATTVEWGYGKHDLSDFSAYGDGMWNAVFTLADGSQHTVRFRFGHWNGSALQMPGQAPDVQQPQAAHGRARAGVYRDLALQWIPYTGTDANWVHVDIESYGRNVFEDDHWTEYRQDFDAPFTNQRAPDPGTCVFADVPEGVYQIGFYLADAEETLSPESIDLTVAKACGTRLDLLVYETDWLPLGGVLDSVQVRRLNLTSVNQTVTGTFNADITCVAGAIIAGIRLRSPTGEWLDLQPDPQTGHWTHRVTGSIPTIAQRFPPGFYDLEVQYNDGRALVYRTLGIEAVEQDLADLAEVTQVPELAAPTGQTTSPVDFWWGAWSDPAKNGADFLVRRMGLTTWEIQRTSLRGGYVGVALEPGSYIARLVSWHKRVYGTRGISKEVAFGTAAEFPFTVVDGASTRDVVLALHPRWNLISLPVAPYPETDPEVVFAGVKLGPAWTWNDTLQTFEKALVLEPKRGYWLYVPGWGGGTFSVTVSGTVLPDGNVHLSHGWNLVGAVLGPGAHVDVPSGCSAWRWDGDRYQPASLLDYAGGYWMYCPLPDGQDVNLGD